MFAARTLAALGLLGAAAGLAAGERDAAVARQKEAAQAALKAGRLTAATVETDDLLVYAAGPSDRAKPLATALQKAHAAAAKALRPEDGKAVWDGKLTVYVVPDARPFKALALQALKRPVPGRETVVLAVAGDVPAVAVGATVGEKPTADQLTADAAGAVVAGVLAKAAAPGEPPEWLKRGFGQACHLRAEGGTARLDAHRKKVRAAYLRTGGQAFAPAAVWGGEASGADADLAAVSFAEFLAFGPPAGKFPAFVAGFKPTDDTPQPSVETALTAAGWKATALEADWKRWLAAGGK